MELTSLLDTSGIPAEVFTTLAILAYFTYTLGRDIDADRCAAPCAACTA